MYQTTSKLRNLTKLKIKKNPNILRRPFSWRPQQIEQKEPGNGTKET